MDQRLNRFRLLQPLGKGGMGEVFLAQDLVTKREVALKRLRTGVVSDPATLVREFHLLSKIQHPAIVEVFDLGYGLDGAWYSMEYVPGSSTDGVRSRSTDWVAHVAASVISGLEALHSVGIVHGDLKPSNILVVGGTAEDVPSSTKIVDFGLANHIASPGQRGGGAAGFAAPEVVAGAAPTFSSDLFGLGCCLAYFLGAHAATDGATPTERYRSLLISTPSIAQLEASGAPGWLVSLILRLLETDPAARPRSAREVRQELQRSSARPQPTLRSQLQTVEVVGRERELAWLAEWSRTGVPLLALIGEPGTGRSTLLNSFASRMAVLGRPVVRLDGTLGTATTGPLEAHLAGVRDTPTGNQAQDGVLVIVDNADVLPAETRAGIRRLAIESSARVHLLFACTTLSSDEEPLRLAGELAVQSLLPLRKPSLRRLASARLGRPAPASLVDWLWNRTAGHPGLAVELLRMAVDQGVIGEDEDELRVDAAALATLSPPKDFVAAHRARLEGASADGRRLAFALVARGGSSTEELLAAALGESSANARNELSAAGLLVRDDHHRLVLSPTLLAVATDLCGERERTAIHVAFGRTVSLPLTERFHHLAEAGEVGEALACAAQAWAEDPARAPAAAAAKLAEGVDLQSAAEWYDRAIDQAWSRGAYRDAETMAERVLSIDDGRLATAERWERLAAASFRCGSLANAMGALRAGLEADPTSVTRGRLLTTEAAVRHSEGDYSGALKIAESAMQSFVGSAPRRFFGDAALTASSILIALGRWDEAGSTLDQAAQAYSDSSHPLGSTRAAQLRGVLLRHRGALAEAEKAYLLALELARDCGSRLPLQETYMHLGQLYGDLGRGLNCRSSYQTARQLALEDARGAGIALATLNLAQFEGLSGRPREAVRLARRAVELSRAYLPGQEFLAWRVLALGLRGLGRLDRAAKAVETMLTLSVAQATEEDQAWCRVEACRLLLERQQSGEALRLATRFRPSDSSEWSGGQAMLECLAGRAALWEGDKLRANAAVATVRKWLERRPHKFVAATATHLEAELAFRQGRVDDACQYLAKSIAAFEAIPCFHERAMVLFEMARLAAQPQGDGRVHVSDWLRQAAALFATLGNRRRQIQAAQLEAEWLRRRAAHPTVEFDRGLLERVGRMLHVLTNFAELTNQSLALAVEQFNAERGVLMVEDEVTHALEPVAHYGAEDSESERQVLRFSRSLVQRAVTEGRSVLVYDAPRELDPSHSIIVLKLRALLVVPMFLHGRVVGAVYLDSLRPGAFGESDRRLLEGFAQLMVAALESNRAAQQLSNESRALRHEVSTRVRAGLVGSSRSLHRLMPAIERAASSFAPVLLTGETGTGKDLVAKVIHQQGRRSAGPFLSINCGAVPVGVLEGELFGVGDRAFTGVGRRPGRFQKAKGGTLFLDEIGEMPLAQQVSLLSAIDNREVTPLGEDEPVPIDVRIIAATHRDLEQMVAEGRFRQDLFYRLDVLRIQLPALRERKGDIGELARHFASQIAARSGRPVPELAPDLLAELMSRDWPGNVRELENYIERLMIMRDGDVLHAEQAEAAGPGTTVKGARPGKLKLADQLNALERHLLVEELRRSAGNQSRAARALGLSEPTFRNKLTKHGIWSRRKLRDG